ncbi:MAG: Phosphoribosyl transferase domain [Actinomycetota bacterium]|jgi:predicted phosphoribosyltransferase
MNKDFANLHDAGVQLAEILEEQPTAVIAIVGQGAEIAIEVARKFHVPVIAVVLERDSATNEILSIDVTETSTAGLHYVVDDAIETGQTTLRVLEVLQSSGYTNLRVAVPISPRDTQSLLLPVSGPIIAVKRPMVRRSLSWHYEEVPATSQEAALAMISEYNNAL